MEQKEIRQIIVKLEKLDQDKFCIMQDINNAFIDAKNKGYNKKILKQLLKLRKIDNDKRIRDEEELEVYKAAIGMK